MKGRLTVTKIFSFEMGHALWDYDGPCKNAHGHSYKLHISLTGAVVADENNPKNGMIIDFKELKAIVNKQIIEKFDHAFVVSKNSPVDKLKQIEQMSECLIVVDFQPTCENLTLHFASLIREALTEGIILQRLRLYETATSFAEWENSY